MIATQRNRTNIYQSEAALHGALNHPVRLAILDILQGSEQCVCHMEAILGLRQARISQHLMVFREAGLLEVRREGWNIFYRVREPKVYRVMAAMQALSGNPRPHIAHVHGATECPCPKCNSSRK